MRKLSILPSRLPYRLRDKRALLSLTMSCFFILFALAGCHSTPQLTVQQLEGKHLYELRCAHCHEENDLALKKVPPNLHGVFDQPTLPSGIPATDAALRQTVLAGKGMMPAFTGRFTEEQMAALVAYLHTGVR